MELSPSIQDSSSDAVPERKGHGEDRTGSGYDVVVQLRQGNIDDLRSGSLLADELKEHE